MSNLLTAHEVQLRNRGCQRRHDRARRRAADQAEQSVPILHADPLVFAISAWWRSASRAKCATFNPEITGALRAGAKA
jgi:hypothetical protein